MCMHGHMLNNHNGGRVRGETTIDPDPQSFTPNLNRPEIWNSRSGEGEVGLIVRPEPSLFEPRVVLSFIYQSNELRVYSHCQNTHLKG